MKNLFKKYLFVFEFIAIAILLAVGIFLQFKHELFLFIVGFILVIFGLYRIYPLIKTTKDNVLKVFLIIEILLNIVAGVFLIMEGMKDKVNEDLMRYLVGSVLYLRGFIYFFGTSLRKESTDYTKFFVHIGFFTLGTILLIVNILDSRILAAIVLVLALISSAFLSFSGYGHYKKYRYEQLAKDETQKVKKKERNKKEEKSDPIPEVEDHIIIPTEEKKDELTV